MTSLLVRFVQNQFSRNIYKFLLEPDKSRKKTSKWFAICKLLHRIKCDHLCKNAFTNLTAQKFVLLLFNE